MAINYSSRPFALGGSRLAIALAVCWAAVISTELVHAQFTTVINVPPSVIGSGASIGSDTQLNILPGGEVGPDFDAGASNGSSTNVEVNLLGGRVEFGLNAYSGAAVNVSSGEIADRFTAAVGSVVTISGGTIGDDFTAVVGANLTIIGNEFRLDGMPVAGLDAIGNTAVVDLASGNLLSGTLADGTPFTFLNNWDDRILTPITLQAAALPAVGPPVINLPSDAQPASIRQGQTLTVGAGGGLSANFQAGRGSTVIVNGGSVGGNFESAGANVQITSGFVDREFDAVDGSVVSISGGEIGWEFAVAAGGAVNISGGLIDPYFYAHPGSQVQLSGGTIRDFFTAQIGSAMTISGGEFRIDGEPVAGLEVPGNTMPINVPANGILSGTFADGTPFAFSDQDGDYLADGTLALQAAALPAVGPAMINVPSDPAPKWIRGGQKLFLASGGALGPDFAAGWDSEVVITGGTVAENFEATGSHVTISGGTIEERFDALAGSVVEISAGAIGYFFDAGNGSVVHISGGSVAPYLSARHGSRVSISGGTIGDHFTAYNGSTVNVSGGNIGKNFNVYAAELNMTGGQVGDGFAAHFDSVVNVSGGQIGKDIDVWYDSVVNIAGGQVGSDFVVAWGDSVVNISGGTIGGYFLALGVDPASDTGATINLFGTQFVLNGVNVTSSLTANVPFTIVDRDVLLAGLLADGSPFDLMLNASGTSGQDYFSSSANLTVTLVDFLPGDFNRNGVVDAADYTVWRDALGSSVAIGAGADGNFDGRITRADYDVWRSHFGQTAGTGSAATPSRAAVPEPHASWLVLLGAAVIASRGHWLVSRMHCRRIRPCAPTKRAA